MELTLQDIFDWIEYHTLTDDTAFWLEKESGTDLPVGEIIMDMASHHIVFYADGSSKPATIADLRRVLSKWPDIDYSEIVVHGDDNIDYFEIGEFAFFDEGSDCSAGPVLYFEV